MAKRRSIKEIITTYKRLNFKVTLTARKLGISRSTIYRWIKRGKTAYGYLKWKGVKRKSTRPKTINRALRPQEEDRVIQLREKNRFDARKLAVELKKEKINVSPSTVYLIIKRRRPNLLRKVLKYRRPRFQNGKCMRPTNTKGIGYLQSDVTTSIKTLLMKMRSLRDRLELIKKSSFLVQKNLLRISISPITGFKTISFGTTKKGLILALI